MRITTTLHLHWYVISMQLSTEKGNIHIPIVIFIVIVIVIGWEWLFSSFLHGLMLSFGTCFCLKSGWSDSKKARKWGILIGAMCAFLGCFDWKKNVYFLLFWLKKIVNQFFIPTFAFESSGTYLHDPIPLIVHILFQICIFLSGFLPKYAVKWHFFHRFCRVSCGRSASVFDWKQAEKWLENGSKWGFC